VWQKVSRYTGPELPDDLLLDASARRALPALDACTGGSTFNPGHLQGFIQGTLTNVKLNIWTGD
jgi:hypothetical protein